MINMPKNGSDYLPLLLGCLESEICLERTEARMCPLFRRNVALHDNPPTEKLVYSARVVFQGKTGEFSTV